jgi:hypothetical protein
MPVSRIMLVVCAFALLLVNVTMSEGVRRDWLQIVLGGALVVLAVVDLVRRARGRGRADTGAGRPPRHD